MSAIEETVTLATTPGAVEHSLRRELSNGGLIEFEESPAGWLTADGEVRKRDYRAYYWTPQQECVRCHGDGRVNGATRVKKCPDCKGTGQTRRTRMTSVSSFLEVILPKPGLPSWYEKHGIEGTIYALNAGAMALTVPPEHAVRIVRQGGWGAEAARDAHAERGIDIHELLREYAETGMAPSSLDVLPEDMGYYRALCKFLVAEDPEPEQVEELVCDPTAGYAGRSDLVARAGGFRKRYDAKTSEEAQIYPGAHVQVGLYERGGIASGDEPCDLLEVVVFAADGSFRTMPVGATPRLLDVALDWWREIRPVNSACESANRVEKEARR
jgi:hypothetical protein